MRIIVCPDSIKKSYLKKEKGFSSDKFYSFEEFFENINLKVEKEGIYRLSRKYSIKPEIAKMYSDYFKYKRLFSKLKGNKKIDKLNEMFEYLDKEGLIIRNDAFKEFIKDKTVEFKGYYKDKEVDYVLNILEDLNVSYSYETTTDLVEEPIKRTVYAFDNIVDESRWVFNEIKSLLKEGWDISKIKIANYSSDYEFSFRRMSAFYKIPINFERGKGIASTDIAIFIRDNIKAFDNFEDLVSVLNEKYSYSPYLKKVINVINSYNLSKEKPADTYSIFEYEFKNVSFNQDEYEKGVDLVDFTSYALRKDEIVFLIGFNLGRIPLVFQDTGYLSNKEKEKLGLSTTVDLMVENKEIAKGILMRNENIRVSYKLQAPFASFKESVLVKELGYPVVKPDNEFGTNEKEDLINYSSHMDAYLKFGIEKDSFLSKIYDIGYKGYINDFENINPILLDEHLRKMITLSYTAMKEFYQCPFKYYAGRVLKIEKESEKYYANLGSYAHEILEHSYDKGFDLEDAKDKALIENFGENPTMREKFFAGMMGDLVEKMIDFNKKHEEIGSLKEIEAEKEMNIYLDGGRLKFTGKIDKLMKNLDGDIEYMAIIDYKTGYDEPKLLNIEDGQNLQLPIYIYLINRSKEFKNPEIIGIYLQKLNIAEGDLKLQGYTKADPKLIYMLDPNYQNSDYIKSMKTTNDGSFYHYTKVFEKEDELRMIECVDKLILDCYASIRMGRFDITPKKIDNKDVSCKYCNYRDVCYKTFKNYKNLKTTRFLENED